MDLISCCFVSQELSFSVRNKAGETTFPVFGYLAREFEFSSFPTCCGVSVKLKVRLCSSPAVDNFKGRVGPRSIGRKGQRDSQRAIPTQSVCEINNVPRPWYWFKSRCVDSVTVRWVPLLINNVCHGFMHMKVVVEVGTDVCWCYLSYGEDGRYQHCVGANPISHLEPCFPWTTRNPCIFEFPQLFRSFSTPFLSVKKQRDQNKAFWKRGIE